MVVIAVTGCVGSGKTTLSKKLSKDLKLKYVDVNKVINDYGLRKEYDKEKKCWVVDIPKLNKALMRVVKKEAGVVVDSHLSHYLPKSVVSLCIVVRCELKVLKKRLKGRKYPVDKVKENLECEVFDICTSEALHNKHNVLVVSGERDLDSEVEEWIKKV